MIPIKNGIIIVIPRHILEWYQDNQDVMSEGDALCDLISKYGGVPEPENAEWEVKDVFKTNCVLVRLTNTEEQEGLYQLGSFCEYPHRNLDLATLWEELER